MTKQVRVLRVVVASPSDVRAERDAVQSVVDDVNRWVGEDRGVRLDVVRWETDAYPGFHPEGPQWLIDPILRITDCDVLIGIFWRRFGTPVPDAGSGTEHEFNMAYEAWKATKRPQIMVYFSQAPYTPKSRDELRQWEQVLEFRERFPEEGLWWPYAGAAEFPELLRHHLAQYLRHAFPLPSASERAAEESAPKVSLWVHGWGKQHFDGTPTIEMDWTPWFDRDARRIPTQADWEKAFLPALKEAKSRLANMPEGKFIDFRGKLPLSLSLAIGSVFPQVAGFGFRAEQQTEGQSRLWRTDAGASSKRLRVGTEEGRPTGRDLLVGVTITGNARDNLAALWNQSPELYRGMIVLEPENGPSDKALGGAEDAIAYAGQVKTMLREYQQTYGASRVHLVLYAPAAFCLFLGQRLNAVGDVVTYERTAEGDYQPFLTLKTG